MDWSQAKDLILLGLVGAVCGYMGLQARELVESVQSLNVKIAQLLERVDGHETRINRLEDKD